MFITARLMISTTISYARHYTLKLARATYHLRTFLSRWDPPSSHSLEATKKYPWYPRPTRLFDTNTKWRTALDLSGGAGPNVVACILARNAFGLQGDASRSPKHRAYEVRSVSPVGFSRRSSLPAALPELRSLERYVHFACLQVWWPDDRPRGAVPFALVQDVASFRVEVCLLAPSSAPSFSFCSSVLRQPAWSSVLFPRVSCGFYSDVAPSRARSIV